MKELFLKKNIKRYDEFCNGLKTYEIGFKHIIDVQYEYDKYELPIGAFCYVILPVYQQYKKHINKQSPYVITVKELKPPYNYWLNDSGYLGINSDSTLELFLKPDFEHSQLSMLWLMLHEYRHFLQYNVPIINSCLDNKNREKWIKYFCGKDEEKMNTFLHVFHEVDPMEVDANTFASEKLDIKYPGSKFTITNETLKMLDVYNGNK